MKKTVFLALIVMLLFPTAYASGTQKEMRGVWVSTVYNLDFPSSPTADSQRLMAETDEIISNCSEMGFNAIFLQVRPGSDAIYPSAIYPWSSYLSGAQGQAPSDGFDPLKYWIDKCHEKSIELHAWINPYRITKNGDKEYASLSQSNPAVMHPEWTVKYSDGNYYYNPALPEVRQLVTDGVKEILQNYDVDGIHMDDYFYPGQNFDDAVQYEMYNNGEFSSIEDWRRNNVNMLVKTLYETVHSVKSNAVFGISPAGIWDNKSSNPLGSDTGGRAAYSALFADSRRWVKEGWVDYLAPQIYWEFGNKAADYETLVRWWSDVFNGSEAKLYIGLADYRCNDVSENSVWYNGAEIERQINFNRSFGNISGEIHFRYKMINTNNAVKQLLSRVYEREVRVLINNAEIEFDQPPIIKDSRTLVPMRKIFEEFGFDVEWNDETKTVTATKNAETVKMQIGNNGFTVNGSTFNCDVPPCIINSRTLIPVRALSEALNCNVGWDGETKTVLITQ